MNGLADPLRPRPTSAARPREAASTLQDVPRPAQIVVLTPSLQRRRGWADGLSEAAAQFGAPVERRRLEGGTQPAPLPAERLERRLYRHAAGGWSDWTSTDDPAADGAEASWSERLVFNLTGLGPRDLPAYIRAATVLTPLYEGAYGEAPLARSLLLGDPVHLGVMASRGDVIRLLQGIHAAIPDRAVLPLALDRLFGRMGELLIGAAEHLLDGKALAEPLPAPPPAAAPLGAASRRLLQTTAPKLAHKLAKPIDRRDWCIGYRAVTEATAPHALSLEPAGFRAVPAPSDRFYADPFVFRHDGVTALFFEDFDYRTGLGAISRAVLDEAGGRGDVVETLKRPYHLSYPFVFGHEGAALMIPESGANGTIELYEATSFPDGWILKSVLVDGVEASDTTAYFQPETGLWWLFASVTRFGSSSHDTLSLFYSERLEGAWRAHPANPVKFDPGSSRPAGPMVMWEGRLLRPTQDCTRSYGSGITWCEVDELTPETFRERVVAHQATPAGCTGLHTFGRAAGFEVVDFERHRSPLAARLRSGRGRSKGHYSSAPPMNGTDRREHRFSG